MSGTSQETHGVQKRPISLFRALLVLAVLVGGLFMVFPGIFILDCVKTIYQADEGFKRAQRTIDPEELRKWAFQEIKKRGNTDDSHIPASELPNYILTLYSERPESAKLGEAPDGQPTVVIFWGGGFFHWVMEIGGTNFSKPYVSENSEYPHNYQWTNGIYYSRETGWPLL